MFSLFCYTMNCSSCYTITNHHGNLTIQLSVAVDGEEFKECILEVSLLAPHERGKTCYLAGGATSEHTKEESLELLEASTQQISWKLGSFIIYQGICISCILYVIVISL